jgi:TolA-binding protein
MMKNFAGWLSGDKKSKDKVRSVLTKLKLLNTRLTKQANKMNMSSSRARTKAVELRKKGDIEGSKTQMRTSLQMQAWKNNIENFQFKLDTLTYKLEQVQSVKEVSGILQNIAGIFQGLQKSMSIPEISDSIAKIDLGIGDFEGIEEVAMDGMEDMGTTDQVSDDAVNLALEEVDAEIMADSSSKLPSPGSGKISDLEKEIEKLRHNDQG